MQSTGTRPQTSPERSGRRGPQVHPVGRSVSTAALHLVGHHAKAKPPPSRRSHISLCSTSHNRECESSVSTPRGCTRVMGEQGMGGVVCGNFGCGAGKRALCLHSHHGASCFSATPCGIKGCMFDVYFCLGPARLLKPLSGQLTSATALDSV